MKVVGAGLGRTGTASLKKALEILLEGPCHHMFEVKTAGHAAVWRRAAEGEMPNWSEFLSNYEALVDWPGASFWPELSAAFPDALVLLSVRDLDRWYESASQTIFVERPEPTDADSERRREGWAMWKSIIANRFKTDLSDREATIAEAKRHNDAVKASIPADRLLVWEASDGWEPICSALGLAVPDEPFPRTNTREEFLERQKANSK